MTNLGGKVALITGASSGIGRSTAILFAKLGATLSITGRDIENLQKTAKECEGQGGTSAPLLIQASLDIEEDVKRVVEETINRFGRLDILVNNAGILERGSIENTSLESYDRVMNINVRAVYQLSMLAVPHLTKTKGNIVNVSSVNGIRSFTGVLAYNMSKAALDQFTQCVALELAPKGIRVNSVNPGVILTDIHKRSGLTPEEYKQFLEKSKATHALGRTGSAEEVAQAIAFLASSNSSFCTGVLLPVDGGRHAMCPR
ncbi:3-oxoacyl-[acyl-carrier-protein] reductase FabG isoform X1 [Lepeophtheirus salmonis]|uniref:3-oxoacyl-acyl-carrier-protein reductase n=1 Tax=Lepeophtheirus salmonis TaxID=72036 RepID=C1BS68_LEPSM|nr:3-oxoacyl-[acyl-carrier-protein] reductase FabG-like isoform X1 [Lepeophtheirus salmonis]ACO11871.1 3-oxoacyl-acyl-carrier-protein reductase [Lepeophtheirus salmonis]ADD38679.1 3-oxoacyl-acyl-carrier-protein reductase [Lepeophtheirus salmonis]